MPHDLNALIGSRICHDLISPLGAIGNGVELLTMSGAVAVPEVALIAESVDNANARIRFFRVAFGAARTGVDRGRPEIVSILDAVFEGGRLSVDWQVEGDCRRMDVKLAFLLIQCLEAALPWGGAVTVSEDGGVWRMEGRGERAKIDAELWGTATGISIADELAASNVHFALVPLAAEAAGRDVSTDLDETEIRISF